MSKPIGEDSVARAVGRSAFGVQQLERRPMKVGKYTIKLFRDDEPVVAGDNAAQCILVIPEDLDGCELVWAEAFVTTAGTLVTVQYRNITNGDVDMLSTPITIDAGDLNSYNPPASTRSVIDIDNKVVASGDQISFDVDDDGGTMGLGVQIAFA